MSANKHELVSDRLYLRQIEAGDIDNVFRGLSDPEVIRYYGVSFLSLEATKEQMTWYADLKKNETGIWWAICSKTDGRFLGAAGLNDLSKAEAKAELGFWLFPENWGKGIMYETIPLVLKHSFDVLGLNRLEALVDSKNTGCKKLLEKLDFTYEGTEMEYEIKNGVSISLDTYTKSN